MIIRILVVLLICIIVIFIGYWLLTGGLSRGISLARGLDNPLSFLTSSTSGATIHLPGQPDEFLPGVDISEYTDSPDATGSDNTPASSYDRLSDLQREYDELYAKVKDPKYFGNPSPYRDQISFGTDTAKEKSQNAEYLTLQADYRNTAPLSLAGWSLQSAVTGVRISMPPAAPVFISGIVNATAAVSLDPGASAVIVSGVSPVGVSFQENICSGYLGELQTFAPELERRCPYAKDELPLTAQNISTYGDECVDYVKNVSQCHFPGTDPATVMSPACKNFLLTRLSYNGCVYAHSADPGFRSKSWRLFLAARANLWRDTHDVIRLLDEQGQR